MRQSPEDNLREDAKLIRRALNGEQSAFAKLLQKYRRQVYSLTMRMLGQAEDAEDAAQDTFMRAFQSLESCDPNRPFLRWIYRIAYNLCVDRYRRRRLLTVSIDETVGEGEIPRDLVDESPGPDELLAVKEEQRRLNELLSALPPRYRAVVVLRHQDDLSYEEIADILNLPLGTVKARMHRAHGLLRKMLKRAGEG
ncbi:MAG: sigma-70 family RNA polymerase sigma factor [Candidatus Eiseniibacteriota bacterium]|nr:MAG: sigma-70 family RNA polymerase sigma factor [Candidatus Eisenbacteria bacterium]